MLGSRVVPAQDKGRARNDSFGPPLNHSRSRAQGAAAAGSPALIANPNLFAVV